MYWCSTSLLGVMAEVSNYGGVVIVTQNRDLVAKMKCDGQSYRLSGCISDQSPVPSPCVPCHLMSDMMSLCRTNLLHSSIHSTSMSLVFDWQSMTSVILAKTAKPKTVVVVVDQFL